jgi:hypothetical protein
MEESSMKEKYAIDNLISGNIYSVSPGGEYGSTTCESDERFIFERVTLPIIKRVSYREIFTGAKMKLNSDNYSEKSYCEHFNIGYITNEIDLNGYFNKEELSTGFVSNLRLLEIYNEMNFVIAGDRINDRVKTLK